MHALVSMAGSRFAITLALAMIAGQLCPYAEATQTRSSRPTAASPTQKVQKSPALPGRKADPALDELNRRYDALHATAATGDPTAVTAASRRVVALAVRRVANLRMLVGAYPQAAELYRKSLDLEDTSGTRMNLAIAALRTGHADEALEQTAAVLQADPRNGRAWHINGKAWIAKENYRSGAEALARSLEFSNDVNARYALAYSLLKLGQKAQAEQIFREMLQAYGDRAIWHVVFAGAYRESKYPDDAVREFRRALAMDPTVGHAHFFLGQTLLEQNRFVQTEESMAEFRAAVQQTPKDYFVNFYLGVGESQANLLDDSNRHLKAATEAQPNAIEPWLYLGLNAFQQSNFDAAQTYLLKAVELTGKDEAQNNYQIRRAYIALGRMAFMRGEKAQADKYMQRVREMQAKSLAVSADVIAETIEAGGMGSAPAVLPHVKMPEQNVSSEPAPADPTAPIDPSVLANAPLRPADQVQIKLVEQQLRAVLSSALNDWGTAEAKQGLYLHALERFHEAEQWDKTTPGLMRNTGLAALRIGDMNESIRALQVAVQVDPQDQMARARLAMSLFKMDQYAESARNFEALGEPVFSDASMAYAWGYSLVRINQPKKASEVLNRLVTLAIPPELLISIGDLYSAMDDYEHAVGAYRKALEMQPSIARAHYKAGAALLRLDRPDEAIHHLEAELRIAPDDVDVQYNLAYALLQTSQKERALALLRTLLEHHPEHPQAQYQFGKTLLDSGQLEEAVQHLEAAVKLDPNRDYIHYQLQTAYRRSGRKEDADREAKIYRDMKTRKREQVVIPQPEHKD